MICSTPSASRTQPRERSAPADRKRLLLYGLLGVSFNQILFIFGLSLTTAINTTILTATIPVFTLAAAVLLRPRADDGCAPRRASCSPAPARSRC